MEIFVFVCAIDQSLMHKVYYKSLIIIIIPKHPKILLKAT